MTNDFRSASGQFAAGDQVAGYRIGEQIGRGGMAVVYRAHDVRLDRWVALNAEFHNTINQASQRPRLLELIQRFREQSQPYIRLYVQRLHKSAQARKEHQAILGALSDRDPERAEAAVREHLISTGRAVAAYARAADADGESTI